MRNQSVIYPQIQAGLQKKKQNHEHHEHPGGRCPDRAGDPEDVSLPSRLQSYLDAVGVPLTRQTEAEVLARNIQEQLRKKSKIVYRTNATRDYQAPAIRKSSYAPSNPAVQRQT